MVATTRQNPAPSRTQPLDLTHPLRQIDSPIRPQNAQVGLAKASAEKDAKLFPAWNDALRTALRDLCARLQLRPPARPHDMECGPGT